jgi:putative colanic acid biosynthesis UDP-glucose lipid carrier transferase
MRFELKRFYILFPVLFTLADLVVLSFAFLLSYFVTFSNLTLGAIFTEALLISLVIWLGINFFTKDFKIGRNTEYSKTFNRAIRTTAVFIAVFSFFWVFFNYQEVTRSFLGLYFVVLFVLFSIHRTTVHIVLNRYRKWGGNFRRAVIVGYDDLGFSLFKTLKLRPEYGIKVDGFYGDEAQENNEFPKSGSLKDFYKSNLNEIDFIYVSDNISKPVLNRIISIADEGFKKVKLLPHFRTDHVKTYTLSSIDNVSIIDVNSLPLDSLLNRFVKRSFDILFSLFVITFLISWLYPIIALIIKLESSGPVIFKQLRNGKGNNVFYCYKFRTMVPNRDSDSKWATKNDPRVTRFGSILRRTSLDELPQFFNVLRGEMAIVGPRPLPLKLNEIYKDKVDNFFQRHAYKPGITGLAQAMGYRGEIRELYHIKNRVKLDRFYFQNWTFLFDLKIILRTIVVLFKGQDAAY